ncbi:hypothetical protein [Paraburkholderia sp. SIMBA_054]
MNEDTVGEYRDLVLVLMEALEQTLQSAIANRAFARQAA